MRLAHGGTISPLCACRRDRRDVRRRHRERARHCEGAAAAFVARRATEWHEFAVPGLPRADRCTISRHCGSARRTPSDNRLLIMAGGIVVHRFGPFELDSASGRLFRGRRRVPLSDTQAAILVQLVSSVGEVVSREALIEAAWGNTAVTENSLRQAIRRLRQAPGDGRNGAIYIETLRTREFRCVAAVERGERDPARVPLET